jgi:hypothetical protein
VSDDPVACYMESFNSQNLQLMISCKYENKIDDQMVSESAMSFVPLMVLLQHFYVDFKSFHDSSKSYLYERKNADERVDSKHINHLEQSHNLLEDLNINLNSYKDPFAPCLQVVNSPKVLDFVSIEFVCKFH